MEIKNPDSPHRERHRSRHTGWLRAAVLGANDGAISTAGLVVSVTAAKATGQSAYWLRALLAWRPAPWQWQRASMSR